LKIQNKFSPQIPPLEASGERSH